MPSTRSQSGNKEAGTEAQTGEKHQTKLEFPDAKRAKTEDSKKEAKEDESKDTKDTEHKDNDVSENKESDNAETKKDDEEAPQSKPTETDDPVQSSKEQDVPASILEKGIVYFFFRGRVDIESPKGVEDVARTYFLLRPIDKDARLGDGTLNDAGNTRLVALPKKVFPVSGKDRVMSFIEKSGTSFETIKKEFLASNDYETQTVGSRHSPGATPIAEGVYAITTTGRESHLAYMITLPEKLEEVQEKLGLKEKGSFILSTKNPKFPGPAYARLDEDPDFPKEIMGEFGSLRWMPTKPAHFDYANAQILLIGESAGIENALEPQDKDQKDDKKDPEEVLEHLEDDDLDRMRHLPGDQSASIFADLGANAQDYPKIQTTF